MVDLGATAVGAGLERLLAIVPALAGEGFGEVTRAEPINSGQRNLVARLWLPGPAGETTLVAKTYSREVDRFFDHHFRREEKILALLNRWFGEHVPHLYGGFLAEGRLALLLMEDAGRDLLDQRLAASTGERHREFARLGLDVLCAFHQVTAEHYQPFYRTSQAIDLDRLNAPTFDRRLEVALGRIRLLHLRLAGQEPGGAAGGAPDLAALAHTVAPAGFFRTFRRRVVAPLLAAPRSIVHNSFSPVHIVLNGAPRLIDYETIAVGAAQIDLAELLEAPAVQLADEEKLAFAADYHRAMAGHRPDDWEPFAHGYYCAAIARSLDYAGTTANRYAQYRARGSAREAEAALARHSAYLRSARHALAAIGEPELARTIEGLLAAVT